MLLTQHNLTYYQSLMQGARAAVLAQNFAGYCAATRSGWERGGEASTVFSEEKAQNRRL
jgi:queuine tRNA-ribosyltransferase